MTVREIQIDQALKQCQHGKDIKPYLRARRDWRASLPVKVVKEKEK